MIRLETQRGINLAVENHNTETAGDLLSQIAMKLLKNPKGTSQTKEANQLKYKLYTVMRRSNGIAYLLGIADVLKADSVVQEQLSMDMYQAQNFERAVENILETDTFRLLPSARRSRIKNRVKELFSDESKFSRILAKVQAKYDDVSSGIDEAIKKSQDLYLRLKKLNTKTDEALELVSKEMERWSSSIGREIYRTQVSRAYSSGQWYQILQDPESNRQVMAIQYHAIDDHRVRPMHLKWNGYFSTPSNPIWRQMIPPIYLWCRCYLTIHSKEELKDLGLLDKSGELIHFPQPPIPQPNYGVRTHGDVFWYKQ